MFIQEREAKVKAREEAKAEAAERRKKRQKLLNKKTRKGQPCLHNQMEFLLEKIEANAQKDKSSSGP